jgi:hypothetical protein
MAATRVNINGIHELDFDFSGTTSAQLTAPGVTTIRYQPSSTHDEPLTDGNGNFIFAATLTTGGDIIVLTGIPN